jgi:hypothetical protein
MEKGQGAGYLFEVEIMRLLKESGYVDVQTKTLEGRGTKHQIDAFGVYSIPIPFTYPIRLIAEAKCYEKHVVGLHDVRSFFGAITDISENYFVKRGDPETKIRYLDTGCFFSANSFTRESQDFAWAQNIFLISFSGIHHMQDIVKTIRIFFTDPKNLGWKTLSKEGLITKYQRWKEARSRLEVERTGIPNKPTIVFGILDKIYPVVLVGDLDWNKRIDVRKDTDKIRGEKHSRTPQKDGTLFLLRIFNISNRVENVFFSLPTNIAEKLIERIDQTEWGQKIFDLDIPLFLDYDGEIVRRIITLEVKLPDLDRRGFYEEISRKTERAFSRWDVINYPNY